jgi:hypothetical protein
MLHPFSSISGLSSPKIGTFSESHSNAALSKQRLHESYVAYDQHMHTGAPIAHTNYQGHSICLKDEQGLVDARVGPVSRAAVPAKLPYVKHLQGQSRSITGAGNMLGH